MAVGIAQGAFEESIKYARMRKQFGKPIAEFEAIQWMLADMATEIDAARLLVYRAAQLKDRGMPLCNGGLTGLNSTLPRRPCGQLRKQFKSMEVTGTSKIILWSDTFVMPRSARLARGPQRFSG